ncbi:MAG: S41 family peptidase [Cellulophaga sp.]
MKQIKISLLLLLVMISSCEKITMEPNPKTDPLSIFNEYSKLIDEKYAMLDFNKQEEIKKEKDFIRSILTSKTTEVMLFVLLEGLTSILRDGHSALFERLDGESSMSFSGFVMQGEQDIKDGYVLGIDKDILDQNYIQKSDIRDILGGKFQIGSLLQNKDIGYLRIPSWDIEVSDEEIENIFIELKDTKGLVLDLRDNVGGDAVVSTKFASYFTDETIYVGYERFKTGPNYTDFSISKYYLNPAKSVNKYLKPVMVLTDRKTYSASTTFLYNVDPIEERIKTVGQRSGGGSGIPTDGYLANGWYWVLSTSEFIDAKGRHLNDGVDPDIPVVLNLEDKTKDEVIERAMIELQ